MTSKEPTPVIYTEDDGLGPFVLLKLPVEAVRAIRETLYNTAVCDMHGLDGAIIDEINSQLQEQGSPSA